MNEADNAGKRPTAEWLIDRYIKLRNKKKEIEEAQKAALAPFNEGLGQLEAALLQVMQEAGLTSLKSRAGTAYQATRTSARVVDWVQTLTFIRDNGAWDLLEARVSKLAAQEIIKETGRPIPGVETSSELTVNVRVAAKSAVDKTVDKAVS